MPATAPFEREEWCGGVGVGEELGVVGVDVAGAVTVAVAAMEEMEDEASAGKGSPGCSMYLAERARFCCSETCEEVLGFMAPTMP